MKAVAMLVAAAVIAIVAPAFAPNSPTALFPDRAYAPPSRIHFNGLTPFVYRLKLVNRLARTYEEDRSAPVALNATSAAAEPLLLLGGDALGRDVLSRLLFGARWSL